MEKSVVIDIGPPCQRSFGVDDAVIVVDVIRSTTTAVTAVAAGRRCIPVPSKQAALAAAERLENPLLVGELSGRLPAGFELTNSPCEIARRGDIVRPMVLLSSSGMPLVHHVRHAGAVYLACFRNHRSIAEYVSRQHTRVAVVGAATSGEFREEDQMCCAFIAGALVEAGYLPEDLPTAAYIERWYGASSEAFLGSKSVGYLRATGQLDDLDFILRHFGDLPTVFQLQGEEVVALSEEEANANAQ